jgi:hypothetical protein
MINDKVSYLRSAFDAELETADAQAVVAMAPENLLHHARFHVEGLVEVRAEGPARRLTTDLDTSELHRIEL